MTRTLFTLFLAVLASCTSTQPTVRDCGALDDRGHPPPFPQAPFRCVIDAYERGESAQLSVTRHTIEGDPVTHTITVRGKDAVEVRLDSRDRFGLRGVFLATCAKLEQRGVISGFSLPLHFSDCQGDDRALSLLD